MAEGIIIRCHTIDGCDRPESTGEIIRASIAHDAHGAHRQNGAEGLPDFIIKPVFADLIDIDCIRFAQNFELFASDLAGAADRKSGTWEGVATYEASGQA